MTPLAITYPPAPSLKGRGALTLALSQEERGEDPLAPASGGECPMISASY